MNILLDLPTPPSVNETRRVNWRGHGKLEAWRRLADNHVLASRAAQQRITGQYEVGIILGAQRLALTTAATAASATP
jgi:hypothetical protein